MSNSAFFARSRKAATRFLQTAVVIDDRPYYLEAPKGPVKKLEEPVRGAPKEKQKKGEEGNLGSPRTRNDLDAKRLIDSFAGEGVVCSIQQPYFYSTGEADRDDLSDVKARADKSTARADVVVLDWHIEPEPKPGTKAKKIIEGIIDTDPVSRGATSPGRYRLIAIYTGESGLDDIAKELARFAKDDLKFGDQVHISGRRVSAGPLTLVVHGKSKRKGPTSDTDEGGRIDESGLPERIVDDFTAQTSGLLSSVTLEALGSIRANTHRILSRFGPQMDPPYVAHRLMSTPPTEAQEHPVPLVAAEIEGVLADSDEIRQLLGRDVLAEWLAAINDAEPGSGLDMSASEFKNAIMDLEADGLEKHVDALKAVRAATKKPKHAGSWDATIKKIYSNDRSELSTLTNEMSEKNLKGEILDEEFSALMTIRSQYDEPSPVLRLGTVVRAGTGESARYLLCIQPVCDSTRLEPGKKVRFPMLRLRAPENSKSKFDLVVRGDTHLVRLVVSYKVSDVVHVSMIPGGERGEVTGNRTPKGKIWRFETAQGEPEVRWVADLKPEFAHRVANRFAAQISRVGLTESEWLRRWSPKG